MCIYMGLLSSVSTKQQAAKTKQECAPKADNPPVLDPDPRQGILLISRKQQIHTVLGGTLKYPPTKVGTCELQAHEEGGEANTGGHMEGGAGAPGARYVGEHVVVRALGGHGPLFVVAEFVNIIVIHIWPLP